MKAFLIRITALLLVITFSLSLSTFNTSAQELEIFEESINQLRAQQAWTLDDLVLAVANDLNSFWAGEFSGTEFQYNPPAIFTGYTTTIQTACGPVNPDNAVYCGGDHGIYYDVNLLQNILFNVGDYAVAAIIAHEWAHLVQNLIGILGSGLPTIVTELQADCLTGIYTISVDNRGLLDFDDIDEAARILFLFGDDLPLLHPNAHGSPQMRHQSFVTGFAQGFDGCSVDAVANRIDGTGGSTPPTTAPPTGGNGDLSSFDFDGDCYIGDGEFFAATDFWLASQISDIDFFNVLDAWIGQFPVCPFSQSSSKSIKLSIDNQRVLIQSGQSSSQTEIQIFDMNGQALFEKISHQSRLSWNMRNSQGTRVANGLYIYRVIARNSDGQMIATETGKIAIVN